MQWLLKLGLGALLLYAGVIALLWWGQERLLFQPQVLAPEHHFAHAEGVQETWVEVAGARLNALHLRLPNPRGVVFFLHGNGGSLDNWFTNLAPYRRANFDLFMIDYRGYGKSTGRVASQAQLEADVRAAWAQIAPLYSGKARVIYGRSLGSGLAANLAAELQPELTVLASPYVSMAALAGELYPWVPGAALRYPLRTDLALPRIQTPVLLVHGLRDTLIRPPHSERLKQLHPKAELLLVPGVGHNDLHLSPLYLEGLDAALARL